MGVSLKSKLFARKKLVFGKPGLLKPTFSSEKVGLFKENKRFPKTNLFLGKRWFFKKHQLFHTKKLVLGAEAFQKQAFS